MIEDIRQRDLSRKKDSELTLAERRELRRRLDVFTRAISGNPPAQTPAKPKSIASWNPALARKARTA